jgi:hypothetical protein
LRTLLNRHTGTSLPVGAVAVIDQDMMQEQMQYAHGRGSRCTDGDTGMPCWPRSSGWCHLHGVHVCVLTALHLLLAAQHNLYNCLTLP